MNPLQILWAVSIPGNLSESKLGPKIEQKLRLKTLTWQTMSVIQASKNRKVNIKILAMYPGKKLSRSLQNEYKLCFNPFKLSWIKSTELAGKEIQYIWENYYGKFDRLVYTTTNTPLLKNTDFIKAFSSGETTHIRCDNNSIAMVAGEETEPFKSKITPEVLLPSLKSDYLAIAQIILVLENYAKSDSEFYEPLITYLGSLFDTESISE
ncbi:MAG: hypothetical protein ABUK01_10545 [Leptospirales bacterium]